MKRSITFLFTFFATVITLCGATPQENLDKAKAKLNSASTLTASFSMTGSGSNISGTLKSKGNKFVIISGASSTWYNGKDLYTYIPSQNETTIFKPTASELAEVNPLLYIKRASDFKVTGSKQTKAGTETVVLLPKSNGTGVKSVTINLNSKTFLPSSIKIATSSGGTINLNISNIQINKGLDDSAFEYPKSKYPKASINDMR